MRSDSDSETESSTDACEYSVQKRKSVQKKRKMRSNIASKHQLNGALKLVQNLGDSNPIISKIKSIPGDEGKPNRMLTNNLSTTNFKLAFDGNENFFDETEPYEAVEFNQNDIYNDEYYYELPMKFDGGRKPLRQPPLCGYRIVNDLDEAVDIFQ